MLFEQQFRFHLLIESIEHVILTLISDRFMQVKSLTHCQSFNDFLSIPVACGPVECWSFFNDLMESSTDLLHRGVVVIMMGIQDIDVVHLQSVQTFFDALPDMLAIGASRRVYLWLKGWVYLSCNNHMLARHFKLLQYFTQLTLAFPISINFSCIKMVDSIFEATLDDLFILFICFRSIVDRIAKG